MTLDSRLCYITFKEVKYMEFEKIENGYVKRNEQGEVIAEITFQPTADPAIVIANHTYVDPVLRGQGVAEKLLDHLVSEMAKENKKIKAQCSYVVAKFEKEADKYDWINADKQ